MERRRLAVLCSHLRSPGQQPMAGAALPALSPFGCCASGSGAVRAGADAMKERCVFCLIVRGESPAFKLYEDDACLCILDSNPLCFGHSLIIPKLHFPSLQATPPSVVAAMCSSVPFLTNAIMKATQCGVLRKASKYGAFSERLECYKQKMFDTFSVMEKSNLKKPIKKDQETISLVSRIREQISFLPTAIGCTEESELPKNLHD